MRRIKMIMTIVGCVLLLMMVTSGGSAKEPDEYVVGGMQALSGPGYSVVIDMIVKGCDLGIEQINAAGGIDGIKMKSIWEDHKAKGPEAVAAFMKLIDINHAPVATIGYTAPIMACAPIADRRNVLLINHGGYGPALSGAGKYLFHIPANELIMIRCMLDYAKKVKNIKSIGLIHVNDDMGLSVKDFLEDYCGTIGIKLMGSEAFDIAATEYGVQIEKARRWNADAIYLSVHRHPFLIKQASQKDWNPQWIGCPLYTYGEFTTQAGPGIKGAIAASADVSIERNPGLLKLKAAWEKKFGKGSWPKAGSAYAGYAYDFPYIVKSLIEYGKKRGWKDYWTGKKLRQAMIEIDSLDGCMGKLTFDANTGLSFRKLQIFEAIDSPDKVGTYAWKGVDFYTPEQIGRIGK